MTEFAEVTLVGGTLSCRYSGLFLSEGIASISVRHQAKYNT